MLKFIELYFSRKYHLSKEQLEDLEKNFNSEKIYHCLKLVDENNFSLNELFRNVKISDSINKKWLPSLFLRLHLLQIKIEEELEDEFENENLDYVNIPIDFEVYDATFNISIKLNSTHANVVEIMEKCSLLLNLDLNIKNG